RKTTVFFISQVGRKSRSAARTGGASVMRPSDSLSLTSCRKIGFIPAAMNPAPWTLSPPTLGEPAELVVHLLIPTFGALREILQGLHAFVLEPKQEAAGLVELLLHLALLFFQVGQGAAHELAFLLHRLQQVGKVVDLGFQQTVADVLDLSGSLGGFARG